MEQTTDCTNVVDASAAVERESLLVPATEIQRTSPGPRESLWTSEMGTKWRAAKEPPRLVSEALSGVGSTGGGGGLERYAASLNPRLTLSDNTARRRIRSSKILLIA